MPETNVRTKSIYETPDASDGVRVLATRYWPRGISKSAVDRYVRDLSPSRELLSQYRSDQLDWPRFRHQFLAEMQSETALGEIHALARLARSETVTLMCVCKDEDRCHRSILRELIAEFDD